MNATSCNAFTRMEQALSRSGEPKIHPNAFGNGIPLTNFQQSADLT